ncbi:hypothetical protein DDB_G0278765 [Dictyostelium discoideum AX4]|uniref:RING-type domain-containing protein n=1 Tax=Dictyostelium discoideum TaxID=44689 RepID=Q54XT1_DICDI|nr:hypothetical protein DDB_G0278765 [Dictyostelium discoideum AX4]EAL67984.1 hypothetical protein DDB_G0278765 [Dictyostelium discoideum AX4]|eukprot:XP_641949.1 hypothetical protein DDB_G0278765 [Dictyostelium discoideum AX4]
MDNKKLNQDLTCCICLSPFDVTDLNDKEKLPHRLPLCSHQFHKSCIEEWFQKGSRTCAYCRKDYSSFSKKGLVSHDQTVTQLLLEIQDLRQSNNNNTNSNTNNNTNNNNNNAYNNNNNYNNNNLEANGQNNEIIVRRMEIKSINSNSEEDDNVSCSRSVRLNNQEEEEGFLSKTINYFKENPIITGLLGGAVMFAALSTTQSICTSKEDDDDKKK